MRTTFLFIFFLTCAICFSQKMVTGFYQVDEKKEGRLVKDLETGERLYIKEAPIFELYDIVEMQTGIVEFDNRNSLTFELNDNGAERLKNFTQANSPTQVALVLEDRVVSNARINMPILDGRFSLSGFDMKKSKAVVNKLEIETGNAPLFSKRNFLIYKNRAVYYDEVRYSSQTDYNVFIEKESMPDADCPVFYSSYYNPLSLIGTIYSYEFGEASEAACGTMGNDLGVTSINIKTGSEVSLMSLVDEKELVAAFKKDSWVVKTIKENEGVSLKNIQNFQEILNLFEKDFTGIKFTASGFCILGFKNGKAKIRFIGREYMGFNHYRHLQLGFELPIKKQAEQLFADANNFYMGAFVNGLTE